MSSSVTGGASVWLSWTAPASGTVTIDTFGSNFDTLLGVYTGPSVNMLLVVAGNDNTGGPQSEVTFTATAGTTYLIAVDGFNGGVGPATGSILITISSVTPPPPVQGSDDDDDCGLLGVEFILPLGLFVAVRAGRRSRRRRAAR